MTWFKWYIKIVNRLGLKKEPEEFNILTGIRSFSLEWLVSKLRSNEYYYNDLSTTYRGQRYTVRKLVDLNHQIHLRIYDDRITGHYELDTRHSTEHLRGIELRKLNPIEIEEIREAVYG